MNSLQRIMKEKHAKIGSALYNEIIDRNSAAKIAQLRTGHCGLNRYLHRFGIKNISYCQCEYEKETVEHYLLEYRKFREQRKKLRKEIETMKMRMSRLLRDTKMIKYTLKYIDNRQTEIIRQCKKNE